MLHIDSNYSNVCDTQYELVRTRVSVKEALCSTEELCSTEKLEMISFPHTYAAHAI